MIPRLARALRWALAFGWLGSLVWLVGCLHDLLGWRGPGTVFVAWSIPSLPLLVVTAELCGRRRGNLVPPAVSAAVVAWLSVMWWAVATPVVARSPALFGAAAALVGVAGLALIAWQSTVVWLWRPATPARHARAPVARPVRRPARARYCIPQAFDPRRTRPAPVATLPRAG